VKRKRLRLPSLFASDLLLNLLRNAAFRDAIGGYRACYDTAQIKVSALWRDFILPFALISRQVGSRSHCRKEKLS
jgi:hypothetical protein